MSQDKLKTLLKWFEENGVEYNCEAIRVVYEAIDPTDPDTTGKSKRNRRPAKSVLVTEGNGGFGVVANRKLREEETVVVIPKSAVLSAKSSPLANLFEEHSIWGELALTISLMYEMSLGEASPWYGYIRSLPEEGVDIPLRWSADAVRYLKGTALEGKLQAGTERTKRDFEAMRRLREAYPDIFVDDNPGGVGWASLAEFKRAMSLVMSRAFQVDVYHGDGMVPFADLFNHLTAAENVHFEGDSDVCETCGESGGCEHITFEEGNAEAEGESWNDVESISKTCDSCGESEPGMVVESSSEMEAEDDDDGSGGDEEEEVDYEVPLLVCEDGCSPSSATAATPRSEDFEKISANGLESDCEEEEYDEGNTGYLDMVVVRPCQADREVFNTYGEVSSSHLLYRYGFCDINNPFDTVNVRGESVFSICEGMTSGDHAKLVHELVRIHGDMFFGDRNVDEEDEFLKIEGCEDGLASPTGNSREWDVCEVAKEEGQDPGDLRLLGVKSIDVSAPAESGEGDTESVFQIKFPGYPEPKMATLMTIALADTEVVRTLLEGADAKMLGYQLDRLDMFWSAWGEAISDGSGPKSAYEHANLKVHEHLDQQAAVTDYDEDGNENGDRVEAKKSKKKSRRKGGGWKVKAKPKAPPVVSKSTLSRICHAIAAVAQQRLREYAESDQLFKKRPASDVSACLRFYANCTALATDQYANIRVNRHMFARAHVFIGGIGIEMESSADVKDQ
ncbi:hypothetical protein EV182_000101 [Spiromyces aspiralis]|uniref:Uncharacterized protein n=1 Tax=Spiromyces aspiralis TaxID=68401 RepID=A0ACC1HYF4_9FUNG|nr:hypothetical protein EV182_000101 [Spiromyces aspiralis]